MKHKPVKVSDLINNKGRICLRCGSGTYMASHKDRFSCGKCHMTEFKK
ncbi:MAG TPA: 30S ribosomal protein S27ae [archaeon]|nr:30S ribosomal protein S27ae [archaeon]